MAWTKKIDNDGKSAYQTWLDLGNIGTEQDFINSLKGESGSVTLEGVTSETTVNLIDITKIDPGKYDRYTGEVVSGSYHLNELLPVKPNTVYKGYRSVDQVFFDANGVFISSAGGDKWTTPSNCAYMGVNFLDTEPYTRMLVESHVYPTDYIPYERKILDYGYQVADSPEGRMRGLKMNCLGDSITQGGSYHQYIKQWAQLSLVRNYGINGTTIAGSDSSAMNVRYVEMDDDADIVTLFAGINDVSVRPLGAFTDTTNDTFYGSCHILFKGLRDKYSPLTTKLAIFTPVYWDGRDFATQKQYVNAIKEVAERYAIPCYDLFANSEVYPPSSLHPSDAYHEVMARKMFNFLKTLF